MSKENELKEHEFLCSVCNGNGHIILDTDKDYDSTCPKCNGEGKLDWIENIVGKKIKKSRYNDIMKEVIDELAQDMARDIDNEILGTIKNETEHKHENHNDSLDSLIPWLKQMKAKMGVDF